MATTVGGAVSSSEMVVAQFDEVAVGTTVESLEIEFDQAKYEEYLSSSSFCGDASRKRHRVMRQGRPQTVKASAPKGFPRVSSGEPTPTQSIKAKPEIESKG